MKLNTCFSKIGENRTCNPDETDREFSGYTMSVQNGIKFSTVTDNLVSKVIKEMKPSKAAGLDKIPARSLKDSSVVIATYLTNIVYSSPCRGIVPDDWKQVRISPIFKSRDKEDCSNYRPITVFSVV